jgi:hypothetical protein
MAFPRCQHHIFLSHCADDRAWLVHDVYNQLVQHGVIPWFDQEDYYYGRDSRTALRDGLLTSRHVVFFITRSMMGYTRGWCPMELAYSGLLQANLVQPGTSLLNYELPLFFLDRNDPNLPRAAWAAVRDRGLFHHPADGDPVAWAVRHIIGFLRREQQLSLSMANQPPPNPFGQVGLVDRVTLFDPSPIR